MILVLRLSNSGLIRAMYPSSVVHTGVKSFGCEKRTAHWLPIHWWKSMGPSVVCAVKLGASSPIRKDMHCLLSVGAVNRNALDRFPPATRAVMLNGRWSGEMPAEPGQAAVPGELRRRRVVVPFPVRVHERMMSLVPVDLVRFAA